MDSFLQKYQRQPKLFIDLPSKGKFYDETVLDGGQFNQIPVFGMNAMDEIMFKTPDALFSGEATAQVIRSCIPTILDPWKLVGFDIDYVLIAIRIATYGDDMTINTKCPSCSETTENSLSLTKMIQNYESYELNYDFTLGDLTFHLRPITYKQMTDFSVENYTNERTLIQIAKSDLTDEEKNKQTKDIFYKSNELNLLVAISYVEYVTDGENKESNVETITQFVVNNDAEFYNTLKDGIFELSNRWRIPDLQVVCANEECGKEYSTKVDLDYSNFFGLKFLHSRNLIS
jgi:hypothetical protein